MTDVLSAWNFLERNTSHRVLGNDAVVENGNQPPNNLGGDRVNPYIEKLKKEGSQEMLRREIGTVSGNIRSNADGIYWSNKKNSEKCISNISLCLERLKHLFDALESK